MSFTSDQCPLCRSIIHVVHLAGTERTLTIKAIFNQAILKSKNDFEGTLQVLIVGDENSQKEKVARSITIARATAYEKAVGASYQSRYKENSVLGGSALHIEYFRQTTGNYESYYDDVEPYLPDLVVICVHEANIPNEEEFDAWLVGIFNVGPCDVLFMRTCDMVEAAVAPAYAVDVQQIIDERLFCDDSGTYSWQMDSSVPITEELTKAGVLIAFLASQGREKYSTQKREILQHILEKSYGPHDD